MSYANGERYKNQVLLFVSSISKQFDRFVIVVLQIPQMDYTTIAESAVLEGPKSITRYAPLVR